jgi:two-component system KDP operon response regulator KdpE
LRTALRHAAQQASEQTHLKSGALEVDVLAHKVTLNGAPVKLTPKEFELLAILVRNAGRLLTHRQILTAVWGAAHTEDLQYLRVFIGQLRQKLKASANAPELILTEPGIGYRLSVETD